MSNGFGSAGTADVTLLAALWEELEDLLDTYYGRRAVNADGVDRLRTRLAEFRLRLACLADQAGHPARHTGAGAIPAASLSGFAAELLTLLDTDFLDDAFDLACGATMVRAQNRILEEAQRVERERLEAGTAAPVQAGNSPSATMAMPKPSSAPAATSLG